MTIDTTNRHTVAAPVQIGTCPLCKGPVMANISASFGLRVQVVNGQDGPYVGITATDTKTDALAVLRHQCNLGEEAQAGE